MDQNTLPCAPAWLLPSPLHGWCCRTPLPSTDPTKLHAPGTCSAHEARPAGPQQAGPSPFSLMRPRAQDAAWQPLGAHSAHGRRRERPTQRCGEWVTQGRAGGGSGRHHQARRPQSSGKCRVSQQTATRHRGALSGMKALLPGNSGRGEEGVGTAAAPLRTEAPRYHAPAGQPASGSLRLDLGAPGAEPGSGPSATPSSDSPAAPHGGSEKSRCTPSPPVVPGTPPAGMAALQMEAAWGRGKERPRGPALRDRHSRPEG